MSQSKHTPGPWVIENFDVERGTIDINTAARGTDVPELGYHIATVSAAREREADALLIAAAPDLLEALIKVVAIADRRTDEFDAARAAIAKAKGGDR